MKRFIFFIITTIVLIATLISCNKEEREFTVSFNINFNIGFEIPSQIIKKGEKAVKPIIPYTVAYHTLIAWYKEAELVNEWNFADDLVTSDITLYAMWSQNEHTVSFESSGGSTVLSQIVKGGEKAIEPEDPTRSGYLFVAWYNDAELVNEWNFASSVTDHIKLYAKWQLPDPSFKISGLTIDNYPRVDCSTSAEPLNILIACKLLDVAHRWVRDGYNSAWSIEPNLKNGIEKFRDRVKAAETHQSFINLIDNTTDLILTARTISSDEKEYADAKGVSLIETPIGLDAFIFIVHPTNPIKSLTIKQVQDIYTGKITNWKEVGGNDAKINPYIRNANSGSQETMKMLIMKDMDFMNYPESPDIAFTMQGTFDAVGSDNNSICYSFYYYKEQILRGTHTKTISIEGVLPSQENIFNNSYPLITEVTAGIRSDADRSSMTYKLYELLQTEDGKRVVSESGYIPN